MLIYYLIEHRDYYSKTSGSLYHSYRDERSLKDAGVINNFPVDNASFKFKRKIIDGTTADGTKDVEIMVPLKYLSYSWRTLEIQLINCEINLTSKLYCI